MTSKIRTVCLQAGYLSCIESLHLLKCRVGSLFSTWKLAQLLWNHNINTSLPYIALEEYTACLEQQQCSAQASDTHSIRKTEIQPLRKSAHTLEISHAGEGMGSY